MKKISIALLVTVLTFVSFGTLNDAQALPMGAAQHSGNYFLGDQELGRFSVGAYYLDRDRDIATLGRLTSMQNTKNMAYVGYEFIYGLSGFITVGSTQTQFEGRRERDTHSEWGFGLLFNILDHEIPDPTLIEDRIRVNATLQYTQCGADWVATEIDWEEIYGSLTISFVNDIEGNKYFHCNSIGFFFGAIYSDLRSSGIDEESAFGYTAGMDIYFTEKVSFEFGVESLDEGALFGGIHIGL